jgi:hypothetical protein
MRSRTYDMGASHVLPQGGTLIVPVPCVDGIVVCADKRQNDDATGFRDDRLKVHEIPGPAVFTHHGETSLITKTGELVYDGAATALEFLRENSLGFDTSTVWEAIAGAIKRPYREMMSEFERPMRPPNDLGFNLVFFWFSSGKLQGVILPCTYGPVTIRVDKDIIQPSSLLGQTPMALGNRDVFNELREGNDPRFEELRQDLLFQRFFKGSLASETSRDDARAYAKKLVGVSSQYSRFVGDRRDDISPTVDCPHLKTDGSFEWLDNDIPALP